MCLSVQCMTRREKVDYSTCVCSTLCFWVGHVCTQHFTLAKQVLYHWCGLSGRAPALVHFALIISAMGSRELLSQAHLKPESSHSHPPKCLDYRGEPPASSLMFSFVFIFWGWDWGLSSGLHVCRAGAPLLEPCLSPFCSGYLGDGGLKKYLPTLASNLNLPSLNHPSS
jgi:hypothetical protein